MGGEVEKQHYSSTPSPNKSLLARTAFPLAGKVAFCIQQNDGWGYPASPPEGEKLSAEP